jgi:hypothetical protein
MSSPERIRTAATALRDRQPMSIAISQRAPGRPDKEPGICSRGVATTSIHHVSGVQSVTVTATGWCSIPRSNDGQTILEVTSEAAARPLTCTFGRDGEIRTRGLLLPKQAR